MRHRAKIDWWIALAFLAGMVLPSVSAFERSSPWMYGVSVFMALLLLGFCVPQWYETTADSLVVRSGVTTRRIPFSTITAVRPSSSTQSSFALSMDRVEVGYGGKTLIIAPKDKEAFFADIGSRAPHLSRPGLGEAVMFDRTG
jgi:hypothetical protein